MMVVSSTPESRSADQRDSHLLLTVLGTNPQDAHYVLNGKRKETKLAPLALLSLLPDDQKLDRVVALCTEEARKHSLPILEKNLPDACKLTVVDVRSGCSQDDINHFLSCATKEIDKEIASSTERHLKISIDVTHGLRHFSFLTYLAGLYLVSLRKVDLCGAWYGMLQREGESPFLDLKPLLKLPLWIHAIQVLQDTGSALPLARALKEGVQDKDKTTPTIAEELTLITESYLSALPLELGRAVELFRRQRMSPMKKLIRTNHRLPLSDELVERLDQMLRPYALKEPANGQGWKAKIALTCEELKRQAYLIDGLFQHQDDAMALGLLNEWTVSWALLRLNDTSEWLDYHKSRKRAANQLGALKRAREEKALRAHLTAEQEALGQFWDRLTSLRNGFHHHGMRGNPLVGDQQTKKALDDVRTFWKQTLSQCPQIPLGFGNGDGEDGILLVTPIGNRPGVLFSALRACQEKCGADPTACLVICSSQSSSQIEEAATRAGFNGEIIRLMLEDPYGGLQEFTRLKQEALLPCFSASEVLVNVTGGTTLMGLAAQELATLARSFARPVRRFGLIDHRPPAEQDADAYQTGKPFWLVDIQEDA